MEFLESGAEKIWTARRRSALGVWVGLIATLLDLGLCESLKTSIPATGGKYLQTAVGCKLQVGHNDMPLDKAPSHDYFFIVNGSEGKLYVCKRSHNFIFYPSDEKTEDDGYSEDGCRKTISV